MSNLQSIVLSLATNHYIKIINDSCITILTKDTNPLSLEYIKELEDTYNISLDCYGYETPTTVYYPFNINH